MESCRKEHIVMLPFMAQGHLIPFLALANKIRTRFGFTVTIATTPLNARYLRSAIATNQQDIQLFELEFDGREHGLPPNSENTESLPLDRIVNLFHSSTSLETPFRALIHEISSADGKPPLCIVSDVFMGWANAVAASCGTVNVSFTTGGAYGTAAYVSLWQHLPHKNKTEEDEDDGDRCFNLPGFPDSCTFYVTQLHRFLRAADGTDPWSRFFQPQLGYSLDSLGWLCNTAEAIEPFGLDVLRKYTQRPVWSIGPLIPRGMTSSSSSAIIQRHTGRKPGFSIENCLRWLDSHKPRSVLYVSFGSQNTISQHQMMALAEGLEYSGRPFVWVVRPPIGFDSKSEFQPEWLPAGFEERKQGLVVRGWAPQPEILCHRSTGAFMSHCGWNSVMESLSRGVPLIGWPLAAEQGYNAKMLVEEMGVCVELTRGVGSRIRREEVRDVIEWVMGEKGVGMRRRAGEIGEQIRGAVGEEEGGSSGKALDDFVSALISTRKVKEGALVPLE